MNKQYLTKMKKTLEPFVKTYNELWNTKKPVSANNEKNMNKTLKTVLGTEPDFSKGLFTALKNRNVNELKSVLSASTKNLNNEIKKITKNVKCTASGINFKHTAFAHVLASRICLVLIAKELTALRN